MGFGGFFGSNDAAPAGPDPDVNIPVTGKTLFSPYNFDPRLVQDNENYILPGDVGSHQRGKFERAFATIGGFVLGGAFAGGSHGLYTGINETKHLGTLKDSVRRTQILNLVTKQGASSSQALGTIGFMFCAIDTCLSLLGSPSEDFNTVISGSMTGLLYKSGAGLIKMRNGLIVGFVVSGVYTALTTERWRRH